MLKTSLIILSRHEAFPHQYDENILFSSQKRGGKRLSLRPNAIVSMTWQTTALHTNECQYMGN
jgi:hypothetical protein